MHSKNSIWAIGLLTLFFAGNNPVYDTNNIIALAEISGCITLQKNEITNSEQLFLYHSALDRLIDGKQKKVNIVHIGDSHLQADLAGENLRKLLQNNFGNGGRGFIFPFDAVGTNNPNNYGSHFSSHWDGHSILRNKETQMGILGYKMNTTDTNAFLKIFPYHFGHNYSFDKAKVFYSSEYNSLTPNFDNSNHTYQTYDEARLSSHYSEVFYHQYQDTFHLKLNKDYLEQNDFQFYGLSLENDQYGLLYHSIGYNGSTVSSYLSHEYLSEHLSALDADLIVLSLGTNDAYVPSKSFCEHCFRDNLFLLIQTLKVACPTASILITTPPDSYYYKRYSNPNIPKVVKQIRELAFEENLALYDFYALMGGKESMALWNRASLSKDDKVHFTPNGYLLRAKLLFEALMAAYEKKNEN